MTAEALPVARPHLSQPRRPSSRRLWDTTLRVHGSDAVNISYEGAAGRRPLCVLKLNRDRLANRFGVSHQRVDCDIRVGVVLELAE